MSSGNTRHKRFQQCLGLLLALFLLAGLAGCANQRTEEELTEAELYQKAHKSLEKKSFINAIEQLEELEARFPYGDFAEQSQLDLVYTRYKSLDYPAAAAQADRFLRTYPSSPHLDYVLYLKGMAYFDMNLGMLSRFSEAEDAQKDMGNYDQAFRTFDQLARRYPDSQFSPDARSRMLYIRQQMAAQELHAARYYARRGALIAAANRAQQVALHFQGTPSTEEALAIMSKAYSGLGQADLAEKSRLVLASNWPDSEYLDGQQVTIKWWPKEKGYWLSLLTFDLF